MTSRRKTFSLLKTPSALVAAAALAVVVGVAMPAQAASPTDNRFVATELGAQAASPTDDRFVATEVPDSPAGRQLQWLIDASARLPLSEGELRAHFAKELLAMPGLSPAETNKGFGLLFGSSGIQLRGLVAVEPRALVAVVTGATGNELVVTLVVDRKGFIGFPTGITAASTAPAVALPTPSGREAVGTDVVSLVDRARGGRRLMLTRWYPAVASSRNKPRAAYASPRLRAVLGLPRVRVHARLGSRPLPGRLPVVLFSPGLNGPRVLYQALAEDLASHGYLVVAVDHTGEAPVELPDGRVELPTSWTHPPKAATFEASLRESQATRVLDLRLILRSLGVASKGPRPDLGRVASMGHSFGGSTSAALMRIEPRILAGIDLDGSIFGAAAKRGVPRAFLIIGTGGRDSSTRGLLEHSSGPRLELSIKGLVHGSFSDLPVVSPGAVSVGKWRASAKDIVMQRVYVRAFLDRYVRGLPSPLLDGPSPRFPRVTFTYRGL
ncbi:MAG: Cpe/LpqF family protein [Gaiellaceae bacterium MAG52_C11]|nr:Cpe/LpqF family protein [Candidatus Gaiellasilicea maunaloa]